MADQNKAEPKTTEPNPLFRQEALERLSSPERLDELMRVVNLKSWLPLGTIGALLGAGLIWSFVGRIPITTSGRGMLVQRDANTGELVALLHFENSYRGQIRAGMPVVLMPETLRLYNDRGVLAEVEEVVEPPALTLRDVRTIRSEEGMIEAQEMDVQALEANNDGRLEVIAQMTPEAFLLPQDSLVVGVAVEGRITLEEKAPIAFVFPFFDR
jgi:hypothetical protein